MKKNNILNTLLIILSFLLAFLLPFKLFLISYAILGPLHYLTEINWIKNKRFFVDNNKTWIISCIILAVIVAIPFVFKLDFIVTFFKNTKLNTAVNWLSKYTNIAIFLAFSLSVFFSFKVYRLNVFVYAFIIFLVAFFLIKFDFFNVWIGLFLPTVIHVYIFTLLFMLYGCLKSKSTIGLINVFVVILVPFVIAFLEVKPFGFSKYIFNTYVDNNFYVLNIKISEFLNFSDGKNFDFSNQIVLKIQMFISFAYTYHYLNWFSKTTVIGWYKNTTKSQLITLVLLWLLSLSVYYYDYRAGLILMLFLSYMHVFLEFPLNVISIKGIINYVTKK